MLPARLVLVGLRRAGRITMDQTWGGTREPAINSGIRSRDAHALVLPLDDRERRQAGDREVCDSPGGSRPAIATGGYQPRFGRQRASRQWRDVCGFRLATSQTLADSPSSPSSVSRRSREKRRAAVLADGFRPFWASRAGRSGVDLFIRSSRPQPRHAGARSRYALDRL